MPPRKDAKSWEEFMQSPPAEMAQIVCSPATVHLFADALKKEGYSPGKTDLSKKVDFAYGEIPIYATEKMPIGYIATYNKAGESLGWFHVKI
jgi:hypothetical protein